MEILEKMEYITLNNGVKMPMAGLGTFLLSPDEAQESVYAALKEGYQLIDTANAYVNEEEVSIRNRTSHFWSRCHIENFRIFPLSINLW